MRLVVDLIRGVNVEKALYTLKFLNKEAAIRVEKLLLSAIKNWEAKNEGQRVEDSALFVKEVSVGGGRQNKRMRPAPQGRGHRILKRSNHITIVVASSEAPALVTPLTNTEPVAMTEVEPVGSTVPVVLKLATHGFCKAVVGVAPVVPVITPIFAPLFTSIVF